MTSANDVNLSSTRLIFVNSHVGDGKVVGKLNGGGGEVGGWGWDVSGGGEV